MSSPSSSREEIAREIKQIFNYIKTKNSDKEYVAAACKKLRAKSEHGYMGLVRLLHKYGYLNALLEVNHSSSNEIAKQAVEDKAKQVHQRSKNARTLSTSSAPAEIQIQQTTSVQQEVVNDPPLSRPRSSADLHRSERYARTKCLLSKSGLLGITNKTAELLKKNRQLQRDLDSLKEQTEAFVQSVLSNPSNQGLQRTSSGTANNSSGPFIVMNQTNSTSVTTTTPGETGTLEATEFASILAGIYDLELPSVILAPVAVEQVIAEPGPVKPLSNHLHHRRPSSSSDLSPPAQKRPKISTSSD